MKDTFGSKPKFSVDGEIIDRKGNAVDPGECIIFKVTDLALVKVLRYYFGFCSTSDSPKQHVDDVIRLSEEVKAWQKANKDRVKAAD